MYKSFGKKYPKVNERTFKNRTITINEWKPPKCYYDEDERILNWLIECFEKNDQRNFSIIERGKTKFKSLDCSIMDIADDIAYSIHDLEDAATLNLIKENDFKIHFNRPDQVNINFNIDNFIKNLFSSHVNRKSVIGELSTTERNHVLNKGQTTVDIEKARIEQQSSSTVIEKLTNIFQKKS